VFIQFEIWKIYQLKNLSTDKRRAVSCYSVTWSRELAWSAHILSINDIGPLCMTIVKGTILILTIKWLVGTLLLDFWSPTLSCPFEYWNTATQSSSHEKPSSFEAQSRELLSVIEKTAPILPVPLEFRNSPPAPKNHLW
jgi:hypothetical protein